MARIITAVAIITASLYGMTEIYNVEVYQNLHDSLKYDKVAQTFVATSDSIVRIEAFVGYSPGAGKYYFDIDEIPGVEADTNAPVRGWCWIGRDLSNPVPVTKGKEYTLKFWHSNPSDTATHFYYRPNDEGGYPHGQLTNPNMPNYDLCAHVLGRNDTTGDYFGMCFSHIYPSMWGWDRIEDMVKILADTLGIKWARVHIPMFDITQHGSIQACSTWNPQDSIIALLKRHDVEVLLQLSKSDTFCTSCKLETIIQGNPPETIIQWADTAGGWTEWYDYPPIGLDYTYSDTAHNYWSKLLTLVYDRYGPDGWLWDSIYHGSREDTVRYFLLWNENNTLGDTFTAGSRRGDGWWNYPLRYYPSEWYPPSSNDSGYTTSMCSLYTRLVLVSDSIFDDCFPPQVPYFLITNATYRVNEDYPPDDMVKGKDWVRMYEGYVGDDPGHAISIHPYQPPKSHDGIFYPETLEADVDTMRQVIDDPGKELWIDEIGWSTVEVSENQQANYLVESYVTGLGLSETVLRPVQKMFWYCLNSEPDRSHFDIIKNDLTKKKGFFACKQMISQLKEMKYCQMKNLQTWGPDSNIDFIEKGRCYEFEGDPGEPRKWVLWKNAGGEVDSILVKLPVASDQVDKIAIDYTDGTGDSLRMNAGLDGYFGLTVKENPVWVKEVDSVHICDLRVDSIWPDREPQDSVKFVLYAKIKNIGNKAAPTNQETLKVLFTANDTLVLDTVPYTLQINQWGDGEDSIVIHTDTLCLYHAGAPYLLKGHANFDRNFNERSFANNAGLRFSACRYPLKKAITYPVDSQQVAGTITIQGWAYDPNGDFWKYTLYYYDDRTGEWHGCDPDSVSYSEVYPLQSPGGPSGGNLGDWNTTTVTNGEYDLKLTVYDTLGHQTDTTIIDVYVFNDPFGGGDGFGGLGAPAGLGYGDSLIFVTDQSGEVISYDLKGQEVDRFAVEDSSGIGTPTGLFRSDYLWVVDEKHENIKGYQDKKVKKKVKVSEPRYITKGIWVTSEDQILRIDKEGKVKAKVEVKKPKGIYAFKDYLLAAQDRSNKLLWIDTTGQVVDTTYAQGLTDPSHLTGDEHRFIYIADSARVGVYDSDGSLLFAVPAADPGWLLRFGPYLFVSFADHIQRYQLFGKPRQGGGGPQEGGSHYFFSFRSFPNPFPRALNIVYSLARKARPKVMVYDVTGRRVRGYDYGEKGPGFYQAVIRPKLPNGVYFIKFEAGSFRKLNKVVLVR